MKIVHLINDTYQVVSEDEKTIIFQGSKEECDNFIECENFKPHLFFINLF